jgi:8-oxo-dGTP pyrophosphatase MutT (NUDIX family)
MVKSAKRQRSKAVHPAPGQPPQLQVGALCWRRSATRGLRILLITSRDTGRWVIPKGWPMRNRSEPEAAAREAWEEAGVRGRIVPRSIGIYTYLKALGKNRFLPCVVQVFPLEVQEMLRTYPETRQRRAKWFAPEKAAGRVAEPDLAALIRGFDPEEAAAAAAPPPEGPAGAGHAASGPAG